MSGLDWLRRLWHGLRLAKGAARPLFVLGPPRSGTTLVARLLNSHPQVLVTNELRALTFFEKALTEIPTGDKGGLHCARVHGVRLAEQLRAAGRGIVERAYAAIAVDEQKRDLRYWGDKNPHVSLALDLLHEWFPRAALVAVRRDPRDTVCSILELWVRMGLLPERSDEAVGFDVADERLVGCCRDVRQTLEREDAYFAQRDPADVFVLDYEALVRDPDEVLRALFAGFLGLDDWALAKAAMEGMREQDVHGALQGRVDFAARSLGRWRRDLSPAQQAVVDAEFAGYPR